MKVNIVSAIIALVTSTLIAFGLYSFCRYADMQWLVTIFGGISIFLTLGTTIAVSFTQPRTSVNAKVVSGISALLLLISNIVFCCLTAFSMPLYVIINGLLILLWFILTYAFARTKQ